MAFLIRLLRRRKIAAIPGSRLLLILLVLLPVFSNAQVLERRTEDNIKAAFLYKFCDYIEWPNRVFMNTDSTLTIGVMGAEDLASDLEKIVVNRQVQGRSIAIKKINFGEPITGIHVLFIGRFQDHDVEDIIKDARMQSTLTVTEQDKFKATGSVINFVVINDRVRFDVALAMAKKSNLKISSRLLAVARNVIHETS